MRSLWGGAEKTKEAEKMDEIGDEEKLRRMNDLRKMLRSFKIKCESGGDGDGRVTPTDVDMKSDKFQSEAIVEQSGSSVTILDLSELGPVDEVTQRRFMRAYQVPNPHCPATGSAAASIVHICVALMLHRKRAVCVRTLSSFPKRPILLSDEDLLRTSLILIEWRCMNHADHSGGRDLGMRGMTPKECVEC